MDYQYKTDTIYLDTLFVPIDNLPIPTKPRTVEVFVIDSMALDSLNISLSEKEILITSLKDTISIQKNYIKSFPKNQKLLSMELIRYFIIITFKHTISSD